MEILKGILSESWDYYLKIKSKIEERLASLPQGNIKKRVIAGKVYYYLQRRINQKVRHKYLGKEKPDDLSAQLKERARLKSELKKVMGSLKILRRAGGWKHD
ncbi:MAG: hypothetical protein V1871_03055 [Planctomycetota bacterium]